MNSNRKSYSWQRVNCSYEKGLYMRIERVESLDKRKCKVFTDEDFAFLLYNGELEKYGVCEGAVLEERTERELLDLLSRRAHERALNLLKVQDRTEGEMCRRLFQDGYPDSIVQETIGFLQEYHFVDDARYAANYLQVHGKRKSQAELKLYLQRKGISREIIREQLEETEHDSGGHIDFIIREAVALGADPIRAIKMGTLHTAEYFGLKKRGAVAPGYRADLTVLNNLRDFQVLRVYKDGKLAAENGKVIFEKAAETPEWEAEIKKRVFHSFHCRPIQSSDLALTKKENQIRVIDLVSHELITKERIENWTELPGLAAGVNPEKDVVKLVAMERHEGNGHIGIGFLGNYGLKKGAVATSVGHDSHNLVIAGVTDEDIAAAGNRVVENEGGLAIAVDGKVVLDLPLKIAGLMSELPVEEVDRRLEAMKSLSQELGVHEDVDAFMTLAFVSLPVIPKLRLNTYGVIDAEKQQIVDVFYSI